MSRIFNWKWTKDKRWIQVQDDKTWGTMLQAYRTVYPSTSQERSGWRMATPAEVNACLAIEAYHERRDANLSLKEVIAKKERERVERQEREQREYKWRMKQKSDRQRDNDLQRYLAGLPPKKYQ